MGPVRQNPIQRTVSTAQKEGLEPIRSHSSNLENFLRKTAGKFSPMHSYYVKMN